MRWSRWRDRPSRIPRGAGLPVVFSRMIDARLHGDMQRVDPVFARPFEVRQGSGRFAAAARRQVERLGTIPIEPSPASQASSQLGACRSCWSHGTAIEVRRSASCSACGRRKPRKRLAIDHLGSSAKVTAGAVDARPPHHRASPRARAPGRPTQGDSQAHDRCGHAIESAVVRSRRRRPIGVRPPSGTRVRPQGLPSRRQHADPAAHQEHVPDAGAEPDPQDAGSVHGARLERRLIRSRSSSSISMTMAGPARLVRRARSRRASGCSLPEHLECVVERSALIAASSVAPRRSPFVSSARNAATSCKRWRRRLRQRGGRRRASQGRSAIVARSKLRRRFVVASARNCRRPAPSPAPSTSTTLDLHQRIAQDTVRDGDPRRLLAKRKRRSAGGAHRRRPRRGSAGDGRGRSLQSIAIQPRHQRPPAAGSTFKPFVYLAAFEHVKEAAPTSRRRRSSSTSRRPSCSTTSRRAAQLRGPMRRPGDAAACALTRATSPRKSRKRPDTVKSLRWRRVGAGASPRLRRHRSVCSRRRRSDHDSLHLFPNGGTIRPLPPSRLVNGGQNVRFAPSRPSSSHDVTTFLVTSMMRSVSTKGRRPVRGGGSL